MTRTIGCVGKKLGCEKGFGVDMRRYEACLFESLGPSLALSTTRTTAGTTERFETMSLAGEERPERCRIASEGADWLLTSADWLLPVFARSGAAVCFQSSTYF